jgi:hypothetical protein
VSVTPGRELRKGMSDMSDAGDELKKQVSVAATAIDVKKVEG